MRWFQKPKVDQKYVEQASYANKKCIVRMILNGTKLGECLLMRGILGKLEYITQMLSNYIIIP